MPICNRFHERLANNRKITTFMRVPLFDRAQVSLNLKNRDLDRRNSRSILKIPYENAKFGSEKRHLRNLKAKLQF